uniref:Uncharacterized protein n=1 Tax=Kalanchoe fedtschenkoi TaxID=63787 RepID=A0A7N1A1F6_KALFE
MKRRRFVFNLDQVTCSLFLFLPSSPTTLFAANFCFCPPVKLSIELLKYLLHGTKMGMIPKLGMDFDSVEDAWVFLTEYGATTGFTPRRFYSHTSRKDGLPSNAVFIRSRAHYFFSCCLLPRPSSRPISASVRLSSCRLNFRNICFMGNCHIYIDLIERKMAPISTYSQIFPSLFIRLRNWDILFECYFWWSLLFYLKSINYVSLSAFLFD